MREKTATQIREAEAAAAPAMAAALLPFAEIANQIPMDGVPDDCRLQIWVTAGQLERASQAYHSSHPKPMIDFTSIYPPAKITEQDVETCRLMNPGQTNVEQLPPQDWPESFRMDLQTLANLREHYQKPALAALAPFATYAAELVPQNEDADIFKQIAHPRGTVLATLTYGDLRRAAATRTTLSQ